MGLVGLAESEANDDANGYAAAVIRDVFMGVDTSHGTSMGDLHSDLEDVQLVTPGAGSPPATAPLSPIWFPELQGPDTADWEPLVSSGETARPRDEERLHPLTTASWRMPWMTGTTAERMYKAKVKVYSTTFEQFKPQGGRPFVVNPADRYLKNQAGLALAIEVGAGVEYADWCLRTVGTRPKQILKGGEVVVCGPYLLAQRGYQGIVNVAMENVKSGTRLEHHKLILSRYYDNLFRQAYNLQIDYLVMSLFGVGTWNYDRLTSVWCFLDSFQRQPDDKLEIALLIPDVKLANTVRRAQMEASPRDNSAERGGRKPPPGTQSMMEAHTWPPEGRGHQGQEQGIDTLEAPSHSLAPVQPTLTTPDARLLPATSLRSHTTERTEGPDRGDRGFVPQSSLVNPSQDPVGVPRGPLAPVPLYPGGIRPQTLHHKLGETQGMPSLNERHIPYDSSRRFVPIETPRAPTDPRRPLATSTPRDGWATQPQEVYPVPEATCTVKVHNQSTPQGSLGEGPRAETSGVPDTLLTVIVSDQDVGQGPPSDKWSLLTFTNPSLTECAKWEVQLRRKGGAPYQELRKAIMSTRSEIGLCPGKPLMTQCQNIFPNVTKLVHLTLRSDNLSGDVLPGSEKNKIVKDLRSLLQDRSLFEGYGTPGEPYRMAINMKWGKFKVQGLKKVWMREAIAAALSSINDSDYMVIHLMVDPEDVRTVENTVQQSEENIEDLGDDSQPHSSSGRSSQRDSVVVLGPRPRGSSRSTLNSTLSFHPEIGRQDLPERGRSMTGKKAVVQFDSSGSHSHSAIPKGILRQSSSYQEGEDELTETGSDWEADSDGEVIFHRARRAPGPSPRDSSTSQSRSRSHSRERHAYPRGEPPRAKNKRAKAVKLRPLRAEPPLRGKRFTTSSGLEWGSGILDISDDSEGELAGVESGRMVRGYPVDWETARALARSPSAERVLAQPGLTGPYKEAYLHTGYDVLREQLLERDLAMARVARLPSSRVNSVTRGSEPSSYYTRQESELTSRLALPPVGRSTPYSAYSSLSLPNGGLVHATGYSTGTESQAHALLSKAQLIKQLAPEKESGESQANYLRRTAKIFEGSELYHDPGAARMLGHVKGLEIPAGFSLGSLVALDVRTPGIDPGEKLVEELAPQVSDGKLALAVAAEKITRLVPVSQATLLLEKLFSKIPAGFNLAVGCAHCAKDELRTDCNKYDQTKHLTLLNGKQRGQKEPGPPKQSKQKERPDNGSPRKSQPKPKKEAKDSKNEKCGVSEDKAPTEDPPKRPQKQKGKREPKGPKYLPRDEWAALPQEEKDKMKAQREAAKAAKAQSEAARAKRPLLAAVASKTQELDGTLLPDGSREISRGQERKSVSAQERSDHRL